MAITDATFDNEQELQTWAFSNSGTFFGKSTLISGFRITTPTGKSGVPDGFAFNFAQRRWWLVECELLTHGVWPHIAEQVTRFVVAIRNPATLRQVRDKVFEALVSTNSEAAVSEALGTIPTRLLQQLELFVESVSPSLAVFIDDTNQDLEDFCTALDITSEIYRVRKFIVNGQAEYYSPDRNQPAIVSDVEADKKGGSALFEAIERLGGGELVSSKNKCYRLQDGRIVKVQSSKLYENKQLFWYGVNPPSYGQAKSLGCSAVVFVMIGEGFVVLPLSILDDYFKTTWTSENPDGTVRHYHVQIAPPPKVVLIGARDCPDMDVTKYFQAF
jgi:hypothetical protein